MWRLSGRRRLVILVGVVVLVVLVVLAAAQLVRQAVGSPADVPDDVAGPVLLVPGFGEGTDALQSLAAALDTSERIVRIVDLPGEATGDIREQAAAVADAAEAALAESGAPSVDVVGYSAGGVVTRWWMQEESGADVVRRVVTLGSPHHGTSTASDAGFMLGAGCPEACQQLRPGSDLLQILNAEDETPGSGTWTAVWTENDETVVPPTSGELDGASNISVQEICPGIEVTHADLPQASVVKSLVEVAVGQAPVDDLQVACG